MIDLSFFSGRKAGVTGQSSIRRYAVAIPVITDAEGQKLVFEVRSERLEHQPGDICFPGGAIEDGETPEEAAAREMREELLVDGSQIEVIGPADVSVGGTRQIYPFVCALTGGYGYSEDEVAEVFTVPLEYFMEHEPERYRIVWKPEFTEDFPFERIRGGRNYGWRRQEEDVYFYEYKGRVIWGLTARIIRAFVNTIREEAGKPLI